MWAVYGKDIRSKSEVNLYMSLRPSNISSFVILDHVHLFWINRGTGAAQLLALAEGKKLSCATEVTPRILKQYLKE